MDGVKRRSRTEQSRNNQDEEQEEDCFIYSNLPGTQGWLDQKLFSLIVWKRAKELRDDNNKLCVFLGVGHALRCAATDRHAQTDIYSRQTGLIMDGWMDASE